jgi:hypothetical protein
MLDFLHLLDLWKVLLVRKSTANEIIYRLLHTLVVANSWSPDLFATNQMHNFTIKLHSEYILLP